MEIVKIPIAFEYKKIKLLSFEKNINTWFFWFDINDGWLEFKYEVSLKGFVNVDFNSFLSDVLFTEKNEIFNIKNVEYFNEVFNIKIDDNFSGKWLNSIKKKYDEDENSAKEFVKINWFDSDNFKIAFMNLKFLSILIKTKEIKF